MNENKQEILNLLLPALQATRNLHDLISLSYIEEREIVIAMFSGGNKYVNVSGDSGTSMIRDILNTIL